MKWRFPVLGAVAALALCLFSLPNYAQTSAVTTKSAAPHRYDITREVTLTGTVSGVVKTPTREMKMLPGSHLMLATGSGKLDASLGRFAMRNQGVLAITAGQQVQVTGVNTTVKGQQVFVTRLIQVNGHTYRVRNEHGIAVAPVSGKANRSAYTKGGQL
jgi:DNA/RNA endonuclease YhcR with UshA esterase domain